MATRKGKTGNLGLIAYIAMCLNAVAWLLTALKLSGKITTICTGVATIFLLIVSIVVAYDFADKQTKGWRILFWILTILSVLSVLFGIGFNAFK